VRILFWSSAFWPSIGGIQVLAARLLPALEKRGCEHLVVSTKSGCVEHEVADLDGIPVHYFPFWESMVDAKQLAKTRQQVAELKREFRADLIHINGLSRSDFYHHLTAHESPAPLLVSLHSAWLPEENQLAMRTMSSAEWVVACSDSTLTGARDMVPDITCRSSVLHNGLDLPSLTPTELSFDPLRILCLGRLVEDKGFDIALEAVSRLRQRIPSVMLTLAGDGPSRSDLEQQAARLGIADIVRFTGWIDSEKIPALVNEASLVVVPSRWQEPFGLVALQAALMERPAVVTKVGGLPEVVIHNETGLLVTPEDSSALADAIASLLQEPKLAVQMGRTGKRRALAYFGWERYVDAYEELYLRLVEQC
jgi:glycogen(starch) synthase